MALTIRLHDAAAFRHHGYAAYTCHIIFASAVLAIFMLMLMPSCLFAAYCFTPITPLMRHARAMPLSLSPYFAFHALLAYNIDVNTHTPFSSYHFSDAAALIRLRLSRQMPPLFAMLQRHATACHCRAAAFFFAAFSREIYQYEPHILRYYLMLIRRCRRFRCAPYADHTFRRYMPMITLFTLSILFITLLLFSLHTLHLPRY